MTICAALLLAGCDVPRAPSDAHYEDVSARIERIKAQAQQGAALGDNIRIVVNLLSTSLADSLIIDSLWAYTDANAAVAKRPGAYTRSGLRIALARQGFAARLELVKKSVSSSEDTELFLVIADGATGYVNIGTEIAVPRFYYLGRWYTGIEYGFRSAGKSLKVTACKLPSGLVEMELTPVFSNFLSGGGDLELVELSSRLTARPGQTVLIGGGTGTSQDVATALLSYGTQARRRQTLITVTPYLE